MNIKIKKNITSNEWIVSELNDDNIYNSLDVYLGFFNENSDVVTFDSLKFGCELYIPANAIIEKDSLSHFKKYPLDNVNIIQTESEYLQVMRLNCEEGVKYKLKVWCNNSNTYEEKYISIITPIKPDYIEQFKLHHDGKHPNELL